MKQTYTLQVEMMHPQFGEMNEITLSEPCELDKVLFRIRNTFEAWPEITEITFTVRMQP